jgi:hypothetical protein
MMVLALHSYFGDFNIEKLEEKFDGFMETDAIVCQDVGEIQLRCGDDRHGNQLRSHRDPGY